MVLTSSRLIVFRRSKITRRMMGPAARLAGHKVDRIVLPPQDQSLRIHAGDRVLTFELAFARKFRPEVYEDLPERLATVRG